MFACNGGGRECVSWTRHTLTLSLTHTRTHIPPPPPTHTANTNTHQGNLRYIVPRLVSQQGCVTLGLFSHALGMCVSRAPCILFSKMDLWRRIFGDEA